MKSPQMILPFPAGTANGSRGVDAARNSGTPRLIDTGLLPPRVGNALRGSAIYFVEDLATRSRRELLALRGIGKRGISQIEHFLSLSGMQPVEAGGSGQFLQGTVEDRFSGDALAG